MIRAAAVVLVLVSAAPAAAADHNPASPQMPLTAAIARAATDVRPALPAWAVDRPAGRGAALPTLYGTYAALQVLDAVSTKAALAAGAREENPLVAHGNTAAMIAVKASAGVGTIYFAERAWKKNKAGAIVLMAVLNGATAAIAARNLHNAHR